MQDALQIAATGMQAQQLHVDTIANNLANVATPGYKKGRVVFHDLVTRIADGALTSGVAGPSTRPLDAVMPAGMGVGIAGVTRQFDSGELRQTESPLDIAVAGEGFVEVVLPDGGRAFSRGGSLRVNAEGQLALTSGQPLAGNITVPDNMQSLTIEADGRVLARVAGQSRPVELGQIGLVRFMAPGALAPAGEGLYRATEQSGEPLTARAAEDAMGTLRQGYLEASNVRMVDEMVNLMVAQRAYEASVNVAKAADEMLGMVNGMRK